MRTTVSLDSIGALVEGRHSNPREVLGPHEVVQDGRRALAVRAYLPNTRQVWVLDPRHHGQRPMRRIHPSGLYEAICPVPDGTPDSPYQFRVVNDHGDAATIHDPYGFPSFLSDYDIYLFGEGTHGRAYERLGAQIRTVQGVTGVNFCTWAPNAVSVSIIGDFNDWDGRRHPLQKRGTSGLWELFVPEIGAGNDTSYGSRRAMATPSIRPILSVLPPNCRRAPLRSWLTLAPMSGATTNGCDSAAKRIRWHVPSRSTRCIWEAGGGKPTGLTAG